VYPIEGNVMRVTNYGQLALRIVISRLAPKGERVEACIGIANCYEAVGLSNLSNLLSSFNDKNKNNNDAAGILYAIESSNNNSPTTI